MKRNITLLLIILLLLIPSSVAHVEPNYLTDLEEEILADHPTFLEMDQDQRDVLVLCYTKYSYK
jgi:hypothetical protein